MFKSNPFYLKNGNNNSKRIKVNPDELTTITKMPKITEEVVREIATPFLIKNPEWVKEANYHTQFTDKLHCQVILWKNPDMLEMGFKYYPKPEKSAQCIIVYAEYDLPNGYWKWV